MPLRGAERLARIDQPLCHSVPNLEWIESEKSDHFRHVIDAGHRVPLLPIHHRHFIAAELVSHINLPEIEVESALSDHLTDRLWVRWIASHLAKMGAS